jgi:hypothetical protein
MVSGVGARPPCQRQRCHAVPRLCAPRLRGHMDDSGAMCPYGAILLRSKNTCIMRWYKTGLSPRPELVAPPGALLPRQRHCWSLVLDGTTCATCGGLADRCFRPSEPPGAPLERWRGRVLARTPAARWPLLGAADRLPTRLGAPAYPDGALTRSRPSRLHVLAKDPGCHVFMTELNGLFEKCLLPPRTALLSNPLQRRQVAPLRRCQARPLIPWGALLARQLQHRQVAAARR